MTPEQLRAQSRQLLAVADMTRAEARAVRSLKAGLRGAVPIGVLQGPFFSSISVQASKTAELLDVAAEQLDQAVAQLRDKAQEKRQEAEAVERANYLAELARRAAEAAKDLLT